MRKTEEKVKSRPILMNTDMVRAVLSGQKIQTRRPVNPQPNADGLSKMINGPWQDDNGRDYRCPFGTVGDRLWVRERWATDANVDDLPPRMIPQKVPVCYYATAQCKDYRWRPSIHMPRWASRITLKIIDVRVERVQGISEEDAVREGIVKYFGCSLWCGASHKVPGRLRQHNTAQEAFADIWNSIYAKRGLGWSENPWVWTITFRRIDNARA